MVDLLQELTDIDTLHESEEGAEVLIDALVSRRPQIISMPQPSNEYRPTLLSAALGVFTANIMMETARRSLF